MFRFADGYHAASCSACCIELETKEYVRWSWQTVTMCQFHFYVKYGSFLIILKHSDQVPEAISRLPAIDDTSDSILDSAWVFFLYQCKRFLISVHFFGENDYFFLKENCSSNKMFPSFYTFNQSTQEKKNETILLWVYLCHLKMNYKTFF